MSPQSDKSRLFLVMNEWFRKQYEEFGVFRHLDIQLDKLKYESHTIYLLTESNRNV